MELDWAGNLWMHLCYEHRSVVLIRDLATFGYKMYLWGKPASWYHVSQIHPELSRDGLLQGQLLASFENFLGNYAPGHTHDVFPLSRATRSKEERLAAATRLGPASEWSGGAVLWPGGSARAPVSRAHWSPSRGRFEVFLPCSLPRPS